MKIVLKMSVSTNVYKMGDIDIHYCTAYKNISKRRGKNEFPTQIN